MDAFEPAFDEFDNQYEDLEGRIEIDGVSYNNALESNQVQKILYDYLQKLYNVVKEIIFDKDRNIIKYSYFLNKSYVEKSFDIKNLKVSDKLNITDIGSFRTVEQFEETVESTFYYILLRIQKSASNKASELYKKYMENKNKL
jgi:DNA-binding transcriptional regulator WhiA